ncbi:MAG: serine/threonine protein kinase [Gammaproteobacteria bacterium]
MDSTQRCMGCMQLKRNTAAACPKCGYRSDPKRNPMALPYQTVLNDKFLVGRLLGMPGGFGVTYLAWDLVLHTSVAIKEFFPRDMACRDADHATVRLQSTKYGNRYEYGLNQFLQEARTLAQFNHPHVVRVREFFRQNETAYLVMDYYEGISLEEYVQRKGGKITEQIALNLMRPVLDGLSVVHQKGFLHRDIKPSNIYLTKSGAPILLDFGAARFALNQNSQTLTVILSGGFAPFEQYIAKGQHGPWIDIYACGATLYAVTTGVLPQDALSRFQNDELRPPIELAPELTPNFNRALMQALAMDHKQRPQTAQELKIQLCSRPALQPAAISSTVAAQMPSRPAAQPNSAISLHCPHCKTANTLPPGLPIERLQCYRCGKQFGRRPENKPALISARFAVFAALLAVVGIFLYQHQKSSPKAPGQTVQTAVAEPVPNAPQTISDAQQEDISASEPVVSDDPFSDMPLDESLDETAEISGSDPRSTPSAPLELARPSAIEPPEAPEFAIAACRQLQQGSACSALGGTIKGTCLAVRNRLSCIPNDIRDDPRRAQQMAGRHPLR